MTLFCCTSTSSEADFLGLGQNPAKAFIIIIPHLVNKLHKDFHTFRFCCRVASADMGVQKMKRSKENGGPNCAKSDFQDSVPSDESSHFNSCSNCFQSSNDKASIIEFENRVFCYSCLRIYISSHYRRKLLSEVAFDLRNLRSEPPSSAVMDKTSKPDQFADLKAAKHHSLTLDSLSLDLNLAPSQPAGHLSPGLSSQKRPKSCSEALEDSPKCQGASQMQPSQEHFCQLCDACLKKEENPVLDSRNCVKFLKSSLLEAQNALNGLKLRYKEQMKSFLTRENSLINYMVGMQADLLIQNQKQKNSLETLEKQNLALLTKVS